MCRIGGVIGLVGRRPHVVAGDRVDRKHLVELNQSGVPNMGRHVQREVVVCALARDGEPLGIGVEVARVLDDPFIGRVGVLVLRGEDRARSLPVGGQDHHRVRAGGQGTGRSVVDVDAGDHPTQPSLWRNGRLVGTALAFAVG